MDKLSEFYSKDKVAGIIKIENMLTSEILLIKSTDAVSDYKKIRFSLDLGTYWNKELQDDYEKTGLELFDISLDVRAEDPAILDSLLEERTLYYKGLRRRFYQQ